MRNRHCRALPIWRLRLIAVGALAIWLQPSALPQEAIPGTESTVVDELTQLNGSLTRLVEMMEEFLEGQEADLLMKRLEILQRRLLPTQDELQRTRRNYESTVEEIDALQTRYELFQKSIEEEEVAGQAPSERTHAIVTMEYESQIQSLTGRRDRLWLQLDALEQRVAWSRDNIANLEALLDEKLGLR